LNARSTRFTTAALLIVAGFITSPLHAATSWANSDILQLLVQDPDTPSSAGLVVVTMPSDMTYVPGCHTSSVRNRFYIDLSRGPAKAQYAMLLAAKLTGSTVSISLNESCLDGIALLRNVDITT
jgi:hypothetical protein